MKGFSSSHPLSQGLPWRNPPSLNKFYRTADLLWHHREALEEALCRRERALFETFPTLVFIDLTNIHYHGAAAGDLQFGRSKQRRNDCPLVTPGLSLDESGFPLRSEVLPGDISEPGTLAGALQKLRRALTRLGCASGASAAKPRMTRSWSGSGRSSRRRCSTCTRACR